MLTSELTEKIEPIRVGPDARTAGRCHFCPEQRQASYRCLAMWDGKIVRVKLMCAVCKENRDAAGS